MAKKYLNIGYYILNIAYSLIDARDIEGIENLNGLVQRLMFEGQIDDQKKPLDELYEFLINVETMLRENEPSDKIKKVCTDDLEYFLNLK